MILDLSAVEAPPPPEQAGVLLSILESQEDTRKWIAYALVGLVALVVLTATAAIFVTTVDTGRVTDILNLVLGPIIGLVGTVIGFYFGARTAQGAGQ